MIRPRNDLPYVDFSPEQAVAFQFRWDKLKCLLHEGMCLKARSKSLQEEIELSLKNINSRVKKVSLYFILFNVFIFAAPYVSESAPTKSPVDSFLLCVGALLVAISLVILTFFDSPSGLRVEMKRIEFQLEIISNEFRTMSGGQNWLKYASDDPLGFTSPESDPYFMELKISIAKRCLWSGDFQMDPESFNILWVRG